MYAFWEIEDVNSYMYANVWKADTRCIGVEIITWSMLVDIHSFLFIFFLFALVAFFLFPRDMHVPMHTEVYSPPIHLCCFCVCVCPTLFFTWIEKKEAEYRCNSCRLLPASFWTPVWSANGRLFPKSYSRLLLHFLSVSFWRALIFLMFSFYFRNSQAH